MQRGLSVVAIPWAQEATDEISDTGSPAHVIKQAFESKVTVDLMTEGWYKKEGDNGVEPQVLMARAARLRRWLKAREEHEIVLVTHGRFAHYLTGTVNEKGEQTTGWWADAEVRTFDFVDRQIDDPDDQALLREAHESIKKRTSSLSIAEGLARFQG